MPTYRDQAVVLRTHKLGEADRIITMLSRRHGKIRGVAKGVRRTSSKFGARLEPFGHVDVQLHTGRSLDVVIQVESLQSYGVDIVHDYARYTCAHVMVEAADRLVAEEGEPSQRQYLLLAGALRVLGEGTTDGPRPPAMIMNSYLLRAMATAGYAPSFTRCARCDRPEPPEAFAPQLGGGVCRSCRPPGAARPAPETFALLQALLTGDWPATRTAGERELRQASGLTAAFAGWQLERGLRSMDHVEA
ncbi:DNA repair protein RecO [Parenemella sanctibonifatiensis]|uniref:DNA repair protein RecO n=1 Tax=Parenemella sanctibonifatiensis TaxID=2016505 RepID=A0A255E7C7_9ACTN|nr:DNA repair protein RecO [Parenemella sanctibonifatiensis]OYN85302.1 DNA repair protein RecO [Parenemella sanctibonifatiensis]